MGLLFISPWLIGFLLLTLAPMVATFVFTFTNINLIQDTPLRFVGLDNYAHLLQDARTWDALGVTFKFAAIALPIGLILPFAIALLLNSKSLRGSRYFQALFFMPFVIPFVAAIFAWSGMLNPEEGWINGALDFIGLDGPNWLNDPTWVYPALVIVGLWGIGSAIIINLAGLQNVPTELYDAARVDGAGCWGQLRQRDAAADVARHLLQHHAGDGRRPPILPGPARPLQRRRPPGRCSTFFFNIYLYKTFFTFQDMSFGATLAWMLFVIILALTLVLFWSAKYWVYYAGETK